MATRRNPVKPLSQTTEQVARAAAADKARKAESKKALRASLKTVETVEPVVAQAEAVVQSLAATLNTVHAANLAAAREEAHVLGVSFDAACESMGIDPVTGHPTVTDTVPILGYSGPMLALRERSKAGHYVKGTNGNPHCGDVVVFCSCMLSDSWPPILEVQARVEPD